MRKITTYPLSRLHTEHLDIPVGSNLLYASDDNGETTLFVDIDIDEKRLEKRSVYMVETWKPVEEDILKKDRIGSFVIGHYGKVCHFFTDPVPAKAKKNGN